jgi:hypothetical protein
MKNGIDYNLPKTFDVRIFSDDIKRDECTIKQPPPIIATSGAVNYFQSWLYLRDFTCLQSFGTLFYLKLNFVAFVQ